MKKLVRLAGGAKGLPGKKHMGLWIIVCCAIGLTLIPCTQVALATGDNGERRSEQLSTEASPCPQGTPCENIDCTSAPKLRPYQEEGPVKGSCKIGLGRILVLKAPDNTVFFGKSAVASHDICEVLDPFKRKDDRRFSGVDRVAVIGKKVGKTAVTLWFKEVGSSENAKAHFPVTYHIEVVIPEAQFAELTKALNRMLCAGKCKETCLDRCEPNFHSKCIEDCRHACWKLGALAICLAECNDEQLLLCQSCAYEKCQEVCASQTQAGSAQERIKAKAACDKCKAAKCKLQCSKAETLEKEREACVREYLECCETICEEECKGGLEGTYGCAECRRENCEYKCGESPQACRQNCDDQCDDCAAKQCKNACGRSVEKRQQACEECPEKIDGCKDEAQLLKDAEIPFEQCKQQHCKGACDALKQARKWCKQCGEVRCPRSCAKGKFKGNSVDKGKEEKVSPACDKCRKKRCPFDCGSLLATLEESCKLCPYYFCKESHDNWVQAQKVLENCGEIQCPDKCVEKLMPALEKCQECKEKKCHDDCVRRAERTTACTECRTRNQVILTPLPTGKGVLVVGTVESEDFRKWVIETFLKKSGINDEDIIDLLKIEPAKKKTAPSGCPQLYGGC